MARPEPKPISETELEHPTVVTVGKVIFNVVIRFVHDRTAIIVGSTFLSLMLWGYHGRLDLLGAAWDGWKGPGSDPATRANIAPWIPWDQEWLSFWAGALLVVGLPALIIRFGLHERLRDFGLGLPPPGRRKLALYASAALFVVSVPTFWVGAHCAAMRSTYPFYRDFTGDGQFVIYEIGYLPFFVAIEFVFRGYLLFGLFSLPGRDAPAVGVGQPRPLVLGYDAILVAMLSYTAWHLGKPLPELWGTLPWGLAAGAIALAIRSILPIILVHWALNIWLDLVIWKGW
jgi:hypothetical protein